ncbi:MAG: hypothetical protein ACRDTT_10665 [Pseudonocardiaceae bacterium]
MLGAEPVGEVVFEGGGLGRAGRVRHTVDGGRAGGRAEQLGRVGADDAAMRGGRGGGDLQAGGTVPDRAVGFDEVEGVAAEATSHRRGGRADRGQLRDGGDVGEVVAGDDAVDPHARRGTLAASGEQGTDPR